MVPDDLEGVIRRYEAVSFRVNRRMNALIKECIDEDLTLDQYSALRYIGSRGTVTSTEIAEAFGIVKSAVTAITNRLIKKGYLVRRSGTADRRLTLWSLSGEGRRLMEEHQRRIHRLIASFLTHFSGEEAERFLRTYEKLADVIERTEGKVSLS